MEIAGLAVIGDGDTLQIGAQKIRLFGIDAFENGQDCLRANGDRYNCGAQAENALRAMTRGGVACSGTEFDAYDRLIAHCRAGSTDIGEAMVLEGHALAFRKYSSQYETAEDRAREEKLGAWAGTFIPPWEYRAQRWNAAGEAAPDARCPIKGNINRKGERIYHAPWSRSYGRTKINTAKGERWFCDEAEALAAGWRAPYR